MSNTSTALPPDYLRLGLAGWPLGHSLSPAIHTAALRGSGLQGEYRLFPISHGAGEQLAALVAKLRRGEMHGLNITIPHKQACLALVDDLSPTARAVGAVNTLYRRGGQLWGENTDVPGFLSDMQRVAGGLFQGKALPGAQHALVLGAGGAARAAVLALVEAGWRVSVAARRLEQAEMLATSPFTSAVPLEARSLEKLLADTILVVNATPVGMHPQVQATPWPPGVPFPPRAVVYDLVYNPPETALVRAARLAGLEAYTGLGMLIEQAALSFKLWTGQPADRSAMLQAAQEALQCR